MADHNVQIVRRYFDAIIRSVDSYRKSPGSSVNTRKAGGLDGDVRHVIDHLHAEVATM